MKSSYFLTAYLVLPTSAFLFKDQCLLVSSNGLLISSWLSVFLLRISFWQEISF
jgi:hypothetical protein